MATVVYDGREYPVLDDEIDEVLNAVKQFGRTSGWVTVGDLELFVGPAIPIAIRRNPLGAHVIAFPDVTDELPAEPRGMGKALPSANRHARRSKPL